MTDRKLKAYQFLLAVAVAVAGCFAWSQAQLESYTDKIIKQTDEKTAINAELVGIKAELTDHGRRFDRVEACLGITDSDIIEQHRRSRTAAAVTK